MHKRCVRSWLIRRLTFYRYDIGVARTDNNTDMRYLINMDYSFDLNINTMGRRIRTRLYFSSESHLHTILNVLRFTKSDSVRSLLSEEGIAKLNATAELCYLTQFVMRVFEDSRREMSDPKRFRVEMLFSPGATATPFHMNEMDREADASRFDTAPFVNIGREDLTCQDVEDFFDWAIQVGRSTDTQADDENGNGSTLGAKDFITPTPSPTKGGASTTETVFEKDEPCGSQPNEPYSEQQSTTERQPVSADHRVSGKAVTRSLDIALANELPDIADVTSAQLSGNVEGKLATARTKGDDDGVADNDDDIARLARRKYFWSCVAIGCFSLGVASLGAALHLSHGTRRRRQWS
jgi:hypothetical protein